MKIEIQKENILNLIKEINEIIISNNYIYSLRCILLEVTKNEIKIIGSSNNIFVFKNHIVNDEIKIIEEGKILIKSSLLFDIINKVENEKIYIATSENNLLTIRDSKNNFEVATVDYNSFPNLKLDEEVNGEFLKKGLEFKKHLKTSLASLDEFSNNQIYKSINLSQKENNLLLTSTDSFRITRVNTNVKINGNINQLLSIKTVREILKIINDEEEVQVKISNKSMRIEMKNTIIQTKVINQLYHDISKIMEIENKYNLIIEKNELNKMINIVTTINKTLASSIELKISKNELILKSKEKELGKVEAKTNNIKFDSDETINIMLNSKYIYDILKVLESKNIIIRISDGTKPIWINGENDLEQKHLLLPLRIG